MSAVYWRGKHTNVRKANFDIFSQNKKTTMQFYKEILCGFREFSFEIKLYTIHANNYHQLAKLDRAANYHFYISHVHFPAHNLLNTSVCGTCRSYRDLRTVPCKRGLQRKEKKQDGIPSLAQEACGESESRPTMI